MLHVLLQKQQNPTTHRDTSTVFRMITHNGLSHDRFMVSFMGASSLWTSD